MLNPWDLWKILSTYLKLKDALEKEGGMAMLYQDLYDILCLLYAKVLRDLVKQAVDNPDSEVDEFIMSLLDKLFSYTESK